MKRLIVTSAVVLTVLSVGVGACKPQEQPPPAPASAPQGQVPQGEAPGAVKGDVRMAVTINGLGTGEEATLSVLHEVSDPSEEPFFTRTLKSAGEKALTVNVAASLEDGVYQLLLETPEKYFREPKGYFFRVYQSAIVNPTGRSITFNLMAKPERPVAESYLSLSAPPKQPPSPMPSVISRAVPQEAIYPPGEQIKIQFLLTNVTPNPVRLNYLPGLHANRHSSDGEMVFSWAKRELQKELQPGEMFTLDFTWDQRDLTDKQAEAGWYVFTWDDSGIIDGIEAKIGTGLPAMVLIQHPQGAMDKTILVNQSRTVDGITVTLESLKLRPAEMTIFAFGKLPNDVQPSADPAATQMTAHGEYSIDAGRPNLLENSGSRGTGGTGFMWGGVRPGMLDSVPIDAKELVLRITSIRIGAEPSERLGPWEFKIPLQ